MTRLMRDIPIDAAKRSAEDREITLWRGKRVVDLDMEDLLKALLQSERQVAKFEASSTDVAAEFLTKTMRFREAIKAEVVVRGLG